MATQSNADALRGASKLAVEATTAVMEVVEAMHRTIAEGPAILGKPLARPALALAGVAYKGVRGVTKLVGGGLDRALAKLAPFLGEGGPSPQREALLPAQNGVVGDYLAETRNPLAIEMRLRHGGQALDLDPNSLRLTFPRATSRMAVLVHGSSMNDLQWTRLGHNHGDALARDLGYTPIGVHYNSGLHVSSNGRGLAFLLEQLVDAWPVEVEEIALIGQHGRASRAQRVPLWRKPSLAVEAEEASVHRHSAPRVYARTRGTMARAAHRHQTIQRPPRGSRKNPKRGCDRFSIRKCAR